MKHECDNNCCDNYFEEYNDVEDDYDIERLKDIIKICEFLIQTKEHRKQKRETFKKIFEESEEEKEKSSNSDIYRYTYPKEAKWIYPYYYPWYRVWF